jgi:hypothetical protein
VAAGHRPLPWQDPPSAPSSLTACSLNYGTPGSEITPAQKAEAVIRKELRPLSPAGAATLGELRHSITNRRIHAPVLLYRWPVNKSAPEDKTDWRWILPTDLHRYATSSMTIKAVQLFIENETTPD